MYFSTTPGLAVTGGLSVEQIKEISTFKSVNRAPPSLTETNAPHLCSSGRVSSRAASCVVAQVRPRRNARGALADILGCRGATCVTTWSEDQGGQSDERSAREAKCTPRREMA